MSKAAERDYSATPLWKKLGIREGSQLLFINAPEGFEHSLQPLPPDAVTVTAGAAARARNLDVVLLFVTAEAELRTRFPALAKRLAPAGGLWVAYPKKSSKMPTDLSFESVQAIGLGAGLVDNKSCAVDEVWTAVRFVIRVQDRRQGSGSKA